MTLSNVGQGWWNNRTVLIAILALGAIVALTVLTAPSNEQNQGSSFSRAADGYGAWYAFAQERGVRIQRWQYSDRDLQTVLKQQGSVTGKTTLLRVNPRAALFDSSDPMSDRYLQEKWVQQGNRLVILGVLAPVTPANFNTMQPSPVGNVQIETGRRFEAQQGKETILLGDRFGAIVWREPLGKGEVIYAVTPALAANAYQDVSGNFKFLLNLTTEGDRAVWVDEYVHGYKATAATAAETGEKTWPSYLAGTPLLPVLAQILVVLGILIWANNRRFGQPIALISPQVDNSQAYIEALAGVLQKAKSSEFILEVIGREEQLQVQKALGLGTDLLDAPSLLAAWKQHGKPTLELEQALRPYWQQRRLSEGELKVWLAQLQALHRHLP
jgi:hypothetical protein